MKRTFTKHFPILPKTKIEFLDIPVDEDIIAFVCPFLIENNRQEKVALEIYNQIRAFLNKLNKDYVVPNKRSDGILFLSHLHEPNEYHLGYSKANKGKAVSKPRSILIFDALRQNKFVRSGVSITNEAHYVLLLVKGIGQDIMSDIITNVCRNIFADFTQKVCLKYGIPTITYDIEFYNPTTGKWETKSVNLPTYKGKKIILLPTFLVSGNRAYTNRYNWFIARNYISPDILNGKETMVSEGAVISNLKDGTRKAIVKKVYQIYKKPKIDLIDFVLKYNGSLEEFVKYAKENFPEIDVESLL